MGPPPEPDLGAVDKLRADRKAARASRPPRTKGFLFKFADGYLNVFDADGTFSSTPIGYPQWWLEQVGFSATQLRQAGFSTADMAECGYEADELRKAGLSAGELHAHFGKRGVVACDPETSAPKIKLYRDDAGLAKGNARAAAR